MRNEMTREDIIPLATINSILANPLTSVNSSIEVDSNDITAVCQFNKVFYLVFEGQLRQFKIKKGIKFPFNWATRFNGEKFSNIWIIDVAGIGTLAINAKWWGYRPTFKIYKSIEDFKQGKEYNVIRSCLAEEMCSIYANVGMDNNTLSRWYWNGTSAVRGNLTHNVSLFFTYDEKGFDNNMFAEDYGGYATKEECEEDNAIQVACFADDEEAQESVKIEVVSISIEGKVYNDVPKDMANKISQMLNKC